MKKVPTIHSFRVIRRLLARGPVRWVVLPFCLSAFYALCSQVTLWLPFGLVPLSIQPLPVFFCVLSFGWPAVAGYGLYLVEGALGAPIFAGLQGGVGRLIGPTGGYLIGFLAAAALLAATARWQRKGWGFLVLVQAANVLFFMCGLAQLSVFVPTSQLLAVGLYPFVAGDFIVKASILMLWHAICRRQP